MLVITTNDLVENKILIKNKIVNFIKSQLEKLAFWFNNQFSFSKNSDSRL